MCSSRKSLGGHRYLGRAAHQAPEVDGTTIVRGLAGAAIGDIVPATVTGSDGVDLVADARGVRAAGREQLSRRGAPR